VPALSHLLCRNLDIPVLSQNLVSAKRRMKIVAGAADR
jgi:hypothetical protein